MELSSIGAPAYNGSTFKSTPMPANSEGFYRTTARSTESIIERIKANPTEQQTYVASVNHEMDEMQARTTANGGVMTADDTKRYRQLKTQMGEVMNAFSGPESKAFYDELWFARDRAQKANPNDLDYLPMSAEEALTHTKNSRPSQEEFLADMDVELDNLQVQVQNGTAGEATLQSYNYLVEKLNLMRDGNSEQPFDDDLLARLDRATSGAAAVPRT